MAKMRVTFKHYEGLVLRTAEGKTRWVVIGQFDTIDEAREAGATKFKPRYMRG